MIFQSENEDTIMMKSKERKTRFDACFGANGLFFLNFPSFWLTL